MITVQLWEVGKSFSMLLLFIVRLFAFNFQLQSLVIVLNTKKSLKSTYKAAVTDSSVCVVVSAYT